MITCGHCGKVSGQGETGSSWICGDCNVSPDQAGEEREAEDASRCDNNSVKRQQEE